MPTVDELLQDLDSLEPDDRRKVVEWMLAHRGSGNSWGDLLSSGVPLALSTAGAFPSGRGTLAGVESDPRVCGGEPRIVRTRIPVWILEQMRRQGLAESEILGSYPSLRAEDLVNAWTYVDTHKQEIDSQIRENEAA